MAPCSILLLLLTITWTPQLAAGRASEEWLLDSAVTLVPVPSIAKHAVLADSELKIAGQAYTVVKGVSSSITSTIYYLGCQ